MKKSILLLISIISVIFLHAQDNTNTSPLTNEEFFTQAELVVEGYFIKIVATYDTKGNGNFDDIYSISAIKVQRVYKGDQSLMEDTVYVVNKGGVFGSEKLYNHDNKANINNSEISVIIQEDIHYDIPELLWKNDCADCVTYNTLSVFFFTASDLPDYGVPTKYSLHERYKFLLHTNDILYVCENKILGLNDLVFNNREDFYNYMSQFEGYTIPAPEPILEKKQEIVESDKVMKFEP